MKNNILFFLLFTMGTMKSMESNILRLVHTAAGAHSNSQQCENLMCPYHNDYNDVTHTVWETFFKPTMLPWNRTLLRHYAPNEAYYRTKCSQCSVILKAVRKKTLLPMIKEHSKKCSGQEQEIQSYTINEPTVWYHCIIECPFVKTHGCSYQKNKNIQLVTLLEKEPCYLKQHLQVTHSIDSTDKILSESISYEEEEDTLGKQ